PIQRGSIGISLDSSWYEPDSNTTADIEATQRVLDFNLGWFMEPLIHGDYPSSMRTRVGNRLPRFSPLQSRLLKGSFDFIGINHYTTHYVSESTNLTADAQADSGANSSATLIPLLQANSAWLAIVPHGIRSLMNYIKHKYHNPTIIITENGMDDPDGPLRDGLNDTKRIKFHRDYLTNLLAAIKEDGCDVRGYFVWSFLDDWEWSDGFTSRFGLHFVDYDDGDLKRYPKESAKWFRKFL
ncbi:hypothetical protein M569_09734, partial [Genlisea aurea]